MNAIPSTVLFVGVATLDAIALVPRLPAPDERMVADAVAYAGGGPAATAAVTAARLGIRDVAFVGAVGDDEDGDRIIAGLADEGVDVSGVQRSAGHRSGASVVLVDRSEGTRAIYTRPAPLLDLASNEAARELVKAAAWVHVDQAGWGPFTQLVDLAGAARPRISVDGGNPIPEFRPEHVDLYVPTLAALRVIHGSDGDAERLLQRALADGARVVVATDGPRGALAATSAGARYRAPAASTDIVSTLGAGDVFHGALLAAMVRGETLMSCLTYANTVAALSCRSLDGRSGIPTHDEAVAGLSHQVDGERR